MYAAEMNALVVGKHIGFIHKYRYGGKDREKVIEGWVVSVDHDKLETGVSLKPKETSENYTYNYHRLKFDTEWSYLD